MWHRAPLWVVAGSVGYLPTIWRLLQSTSNFINEYVLGWRLLLSLHAVGLAVLFAPSMRERFSGRDRNDG